MTFYQWIRKCLLWDEKQQALSENKKAAQHIFGNDDDHLYDELGNFIVHSHPLHHRVHQRHVQQQRADPAEKERAGFPQLMLAVALKNIFPDG